MNKVISGFALGAFAPLFCHAAALETSDQSILAFLEPAHYVEFTYGELHANVSGHVQGQVALQQLGVSDYSTGDMANDYSFVNVASKFQIAPKLSFGMIYDLPYGSNLDYKYQPKTYMGPQLLEATRLKIESENISMLVGYQPTSNWNVFAGAAYQQLSGNVNLYGANYSILSGYQVNLKQSSGHGWLTGLSYQRPEQAVKATLTYRSKVVHKMDATENLNGTPLNFAPFESTKITTPQSVNVDLQTGLSSKNVLFSSIRWVDWKNFAIQPHQFGSILNYYAQMYPETIHSFNLIDYKKDQWSAKLGLAHVFNDHWITSMDVAWDSGNKNPPGTMNPADGYEALGLAAIYNFNPSSFVAYGLKYFRFKNPEAENKDPDNLIEQNSTWTGVGQNDAWAHALRVGYRF